MTHFTVEDYEEVYYKNQIVSCIEIGSWLLSRLDDEKSKSLLKKLQSINYSWDLPKNKLQDIYNIVSDVKKWLISNVK